MDNILNKTISAEDGIDFHKKIAAFSFQGFLDHGVGAVIIHEGQFEKHPNGSVDATLTYAVYEEDSDLFPPEAVEMIEEYEPESEIVLAIVGKDDEATCITLSAQQIGCSPVAAHMKETEWHVDFDVGTVLRLKEPQNGVAAGWYVFLREEKAMMKLALAGMDDDEGELVPSDEIVEVHTDFAEIFERTGINVYGGD